MAAGSTTIPCALICQRTRPIAHHFPYILSSSDQQANTCPEPFQEGTPGSRQLTVGFLPACRWASSAVIICIASLLCAGSGMPVTLVQNDEGIVFKLVPLLLLRQRTSNSSTPKIPRPV